MSNRKATKRALLTSVMALVMCVVMLVGTTFAWFTDTASTGVNKIQAGNLDIEVEYTLDGEKWAPLDDATDIFQKGLWEPGHTEVVALKFKNNGNLALKYSINMNVVDETVGVNKAGQEYKLSDYLQVKTLSQEASLIGDICISMAFSQRSDGLGYTNTANFKDATVLDHDLFLAPGEVGNYLIMKVWMPEDVGNEANARTPEEAASIEFGLNILATQYIGETDSFSNDYDEDATYPVVSATGLKDALAKGGSLVLSSDVKIAPEVADKSTQNLVPQMTVHKDTVLDLSGKKIGVDADDNFGKASPVLMAVDGVALTLNGEGTIDCEAGDQQVYGINVINGGKVVINGGKYYGAITAVQVQKGSLVINGGFFDMASTCKAQVPQYAKYVVNCIDASFKDGSATISITGGTFVNFDPSANPEGANTTYVAEDYKVVSETQASGDVWYTVVKA